MFFVEWFSTTHRIALKFPVCANVKQPTRRIIGTCAKSVAIGEELNGVDIGVVSSKGLTALLLPNVPKLGECVAGARNKLVVIQWVYAQAHHISKVIRKLCDLLASLNVP